MCDVAAASKQASKQQKDWTALPETKGAGHDSRVRTKHSARACNTLH